MIDHVKKWWFMHSAWILAVLHFLQPSAQAWMDAHPKTILSVVGTAVIVRLAQGQKQ